MILSARERIIAPAIILLAATGLLSGCFGAPPVTLIVFWSDRGGNEGIYRMDVNGANVTRLTINGGFLQDSVPSLNRSETKVVFVRTVFPLGMSHYRRGEDRYGHPDRRHRLLGEGRPESARNLGISKEIWIMDVNGGNVEQLTSNGQFNFDPTFSPDGNRIVWSLDGDIWVMDVDGSGAVELTDTGLDFCPSFNRANDKIAFDSSRDGFVDVFIMDDDGKNQENLTNNVTGFDFCPVFNRTDEKILFTSDRDEDHEIYIMDVDGSNQENLTNIGSNDLYPSLSPNGEKIAFESDRDGNSEVYLMNFDGSDPINLTNHGDSDIDPDFPGP